LLLVLGCTTLALLNACAAPVTSDRQTFNAAAIAPPRDALPLEEAVVRLAEATLAGAKDLPPPSGGGRRPLVIDPLIDRASGMETSATRSMVASIENLVRERYPAFELKPFNVTVLDEKPLILLGSITMVTAPGSLTNTSGPSSTYRIWAVLGNLQTGTILSHPTAWVRAETVDPAPVRFSSESPVWLDDEAMAAYLRTCAGQPGTPMDPAYLRGLRAQAAVAGAIDAYERNQFDQALTLYRQAKNEPGGQQARVLNGLYLANWALGRRQEAETAFNEMVNYGLARNRLAVKLLFRPGTSEFTRNPEISAPYPMWLRQIADRVVERDMCLQVIGHTSITGSDLLNDRLSLARAQTVRVRLATNKPSLRGRSQAVGRGSREPIVGLGTDDMRDALDRRVEFAPQRCIDLT
jgi:outer membrane protein OmpA-like peptidoglycan-associated protein